VARARQQVDGVEEGEVVRAGSLELEPGELPGRDRGDRFSFTYMEYELLKFLMTHRTECSRASRC